MDLDDLARRQHGVVSRSQALAGGLTYDAVRWRLERGQWRRLGHGIYQTHSGPLSWLTRAHALALRLGRGGALTLETAAHLHGMQEREPQVLTGAVVDRRVERLVGTRVVKARRLAIVTVRGLPVTSPVSTLLDLCARPGVQWREAVHALSTWIHRSKVTPTEVSAALAGRARHPHRRVLALALEPVTAGVESVLELQSLQRVIRRHGLPEPRLQVPGLDASRGTRRDAEWEEFGVVLEVDGQLYHDGASLHRDRRRDRRTARGGRVTLRAGHVDIELEPCELAVDIFGALRARGYRGAIALCGPGCTAWRDVAAS